MNACGLFAVFGCDSNQDAQPQLEDASIAEGDLSQPDETLGMLGTGPEFCGQCHKTHYAQWSGSMPTMLPILSLS